MSFVVIDGVCEILQVVSNVLVYAKERSNSVVKEDFEEYGHGSMGLKEGDLMEVVQLQEEMLGEMQK